jgi:hypothetical protein
MGLLNNFKLGRKNEYEVNLDLRSVEVRAGVRRLSATWTPELSQNIEMYHNIIAEEEVTRMLSEEMSRAIDEEIINTLTRRINGGGNQGFEGPIQRFSDNSDYFNRWMGIGGQTA